MNPNHECPRCGWIGPHKCENIVKVPDSANIIPISLRDDFDDDTLEAAKDIIWNGLTLEQKTAAYDAAIKSRQERFLYDS